MRVFSFVMRVIIESDVVRAVLCVKESVCVAFNPVNVNVRESTEGVIDIVFIKSA